MEKAINLLFETPFNGQTLFKNQQDLVIQLILQPGTEYYVSIEDNEKYNKTLNRLKAFISQLLSPNVTRTVTIEFEQALRLILQKKIGDTELTNNVLSQIIDELKAKKVAALKPETRLSILEQLSIDFRKGQYISIITSKPLEVEADISTDRFSLRKLVFEDFVDSILRTDTPLKDYRFNFPVDSSGALFWKGLNKLLIKYLKNAENRHLFLSCLLNKIQIEFDPKLDLSKLNSLTDLEIYKISETILRALRMECKLVVFTCSAPIYTLPLIVIDPAETKNAKIYALLDSDENSFNVHKFSIEEIILWRLFVWDKIKSPIFGGKIIEF